MLMLKAIPQYQDPPVSSEYLDTKISMGSYKATDKLLGLLEFCACLVAGADAFDVYPADKLKDKIKSEFRTINNKCDGDPIEMAFKWAWPPIEGNRIVYNSREVKAAVEALLSLVRERDPKEIVSTVIDSYLQDEGDIESSAIYIGQDLMELGIERKFIEQAFSKYSNSAYEKALISYAKSDNHA